MLMRRLPAVVRLLGQKKILGLSAIASVFILINWSVYVYASLNQFIVEAALGYFINPLVTVALGVIVLKEKLRTGQWCLWGLPLSPWLFWRWGWEASQ